MFALVDGKGDVPQGTDALQGNGNIAQTEQGLAVHEIPRGQVGFVLRAALKMIKSAANTKNGTHEKRLANDTPLALMGLVAAHGGNTWQGSSVG